MTEPIKSTRRKRSRSAHAKLFGTGDLNQGTRCSVIVAHPADEVIGAGCLISKLVDVTILHVTDGVPPDLDDVNSARWANTEEYAEARRQECLAALAIANVPKDRVVSLDVPDHFAIQCLIELTRKIAAFLQHSGADIVVTHPYEGGHPDHDATAFATHSAIRLLKENGLKPPALFEMALHPSTDFKARVSEFLPGADGETTTLLLDERALELKLRMLNCFATQSESLQVSPIGPEKFRRPSNYDFAAPPTEGKLYYENFDWAPSGKEWQSLANQALRELFPQSTSRAKQAMQQIL
ncbi:MAG TPA: PIG-L family deacetylase [Pyrinomonadaceae bacterium]|nr:PIG-L family deacetylase [Pyrinomonadaceae bacterium]